MRTPLVLRIEDGVHCEAGATRLMSVLLQAHADPAVQALPTFGERGCSDCPIKSDPASVLGEVLDCVGQNCDADGNSPKRSTLTLQLTTRPIRW